MYVVRIRYAIDSFLGNSKPKIQCYAAVIQTITSRILPKSERWSRWIKHPYPTASDNPHMRSSTSVRNLGSSRSLPFVCLVSCFQEIITYTVQINRSISFWKSAFEALDLEFPFEDDFILRPDGWDS